MRVNKHLIISKTFMIITVGPRKINYIEREHSRRALNQIKIYVIFIVITSSAKKTSERPITKLN